MDLIVDADMLGLVVKELCLMNTTTVVVLKRALELVDTIRHIETVFADMLPLLLLLLVVVVKYLHQLLAHVMLVAVAAVLDV